MTRHLKVRWNPVMLNKCFPYFQKKEQLYFILHKENNLSKGVIFSLLSLDSHNGISLFFKVFSGSFWSVRSHKKLTLFVTILLTLPILYSRPFHCDKPKRTGGHGRRNVKTIKRVKTSSVKIYGMKYLLWCVDLFSTNSTYKTFVCNISTNLWLPVFDLHSWLSIVFQPGLAKTWAVTLLQKGLYL